MQVWALSGGPSGNVATSMLHGGFSKEKKIIAMAMIGFRHRAKTLIRSSLPLALRKWMAIWFHRQEWIEVSRRSWWSTELLRDFADRDVNAYHKFLWAHHLAYAGSYEVGSRFGADHVIPSRRMFFSDLCRQLQELGIHPEEVGSVLEVGCSLGYQLRYVEPQPALVQRGPTSCD